MVMAKIRLGIFVLLFLTACENDPPAPKPIADFFVDNAGCMSDCYVKFYDHSYAAQSWHWDFDNGITSTKQNDSVLYHEAGFYDVTLTIWNADNVEDVITKTVQVY